MMNDDVGMGDFDLVINDLKLELAGLWLPIHFPTLFATFIFKAETIKLKVYKSKSEATNKE